RILHSKLCITLFPYTTLFRSRLFDLVVYIHEWYAGFPPIVRHSFDIPYRRSSYSPYRTAAHVFQFPTILAAWYPIYYPHEALHYAKRHIVSKFSLDLSWAYPADTVLCALLTEDIEDHKIAG